MQSSVQDRRRVASTLVVSAVLGFLIVSAFTWMPSGAVESPDLGRFDTDTYPRST
jgi:hypothetical protein